MISQKTRDTIKYIFRKYIGYDLSTLRTKLGEDFLDQKNTLSNQKVQVIFDVGANLGQTTRKYRKMFPKATIYAFEPFLEIFKEYVHSTRGDAKIHPENIALSETNGTAVFFVNNLHYTNSLLQNNEDYTAKIDVYNPIKTTKVQTEKLDTYCQKNNIERINILKIDVQGGELLVLKGAQEMLSRGAIDLIYTEVEFTPIYKNQPLFDDIENFLRQYGYTVHKKYNISYESTKPISGDVIFTR